MEACIVACSKRKVWDRWPHLGERPAREAYCGLLTRLAITYAELFYRDHWYILSAKYGFIRPDMLIEPYDKTFRNIVITKSLISSLRRQADSLGLTRYSVITVLGGSRYVEVCRRVFPDKIIRAPLAGLGYFRAVKLLKKAVESRTRL